MRKKYQGVAMAGAFVLLGIVLFISSFEMKSLAQAQVGPELVPRIVASGMIILGLLNVCSEYRKAKKEAEPEGAAQEDGCTEEKKPFLKRHGFGLTLALVFAYVWLMPLVGFILATVMYLFCQICIFAHDLSKKKLLQYVLISVLTSVGVYLIFALVFGLPLPSGIWG